MNRQTFVIAELNLQLKKNLFRYENPINLMILMIQVAELMELFKQIEQQFFVAFFPDIAVKIWKCGYGVIYFLM